MTQTENEEKTYWNYRVLVFPDEEEYYYEIAEVHYENDQPLSFGIKSGTVGADNVAGLYWAIEKMKEALRKPYLWGVPGDKFLTEFCVPII